MIILHFSNKAELAQGLLSRGTTSQLVWRNHVSVIHNRIAFHKGVRPGFWMAYKPPLSQWYGVTPDSSLDQVFSTILDRNMERMNERPEASEPLPADAALLRGRTEPGLRRSPLDELEDKIEEIGLPLNSLTLNQNDLPALRDILGSSGLDEGQVDGIMEKLSQGPLTHGPGPRSGHVGNHHRTAIHCHSPKMPYRCWAAFLQELGLDSTRVKDILSGPEPRRPVRH